MCIYRCVLFGFVYDLYSPVFKSIVMLMKSTILGLASILILSLFSLKMFRISFLLFSVCLGVLLHIAIVHHLCIYSPMFMASCSGCESIIATLPAHRYTMTTQHGARKTSTST